MWTRLIAVALLTIHSGLLAWSAYRHSPVFHEVGHLPAGISHIHFGRFELYRVNPPLVRLVAALPVIFARPVTDWSNYETYPTVRSEFAVGTGFIRANGFRSFWLFTIARWACIVFSLIGGYVCFRWASLIYGAKSGLLAVALWCFSPTILGHGALVMPDVGAAALGIAACYRFWHWLRKPTWGNATIAGITLGLAELTKTTLLVFYPLWPVFWVTYRVTNCNKLNIKDWARQSRMVLTILLLSLYVINLMYGFDGSFKKLSSYDFLSKTLTKPENIQIKGSQRLNIFADSWLGHFPVPVPRDYLLGIDQQKADFEEEIKCYLHGNWKIGGWWYFYLYALAVKIPLGTWILIVLAMYASLFLHGYSNSLREELVLLLPVVAILGLVSSQTSLTIHMRYVLPIFPFIIIWTSKLARSLELSHFKILCFTVLAFCWSLISSLSIYPHSLSYFNALAGGPRNGHAHLLHSNIAWGQDLLYLKLWLEDHPEAKPFHLISRAWVDPRIAGIDYQLPPAGPNSNDCTTERADQALGPQPGWYAIDVNFLHGSPILATKSVDSWFNVDNTCNDYTYFQKFRPMALVGYSIYIYHITPEQAESERRQIGLPTIYDLE